MTLKWRLLIAIWSLTILAGSQVSGNERYQPNTYNDHLARLKQIQIGEHLIAYIDEGEGPVVLLIHGMPTSSWLYRKIVPSLVEKGYRALVPDLLGMGASDLTDDSEALSANSQARILVGLLKQLKISSCAMAVHDFGGVVGWEVLGQAPERINSLVLFNTFAYEEGWNYGPDMSKCHMTSYFLDKGIQKAPVVRIMLNTMVTDPETFKDKEAVRGYHQPLQEGAHSTYMKFLDSISDMTANLPRYQSILKSRQIPAVIIWGQGDETLDHKKQIPQFSADLKVPEARIHVLPQTCHLIQEEKPAEIAALMDAFFKEADSVR